MSKQCLLALDTSGPRLQLALVVKDKTWTRVEDISRGHAEILFDRLAQFLAQHQVAYADLTRLATTTGPGSFTGLRIGIAAARGLALALNIPVLGIPNLLALSLGQKDGAFYVVLDARRGQYYVQHFSSAGQATEQPQLLDQQQVETLKSTTSEPVYSDAQVNIGSMAQFAAVVAVLNFPPEPTYVRAADAKPQNKLRVARK